MKDINLRDLIARMTTAFDPKAAGNLVVTIQFYATGKELGDYYLRIENGSCTFNEGVAESPAVTIRTPSEVWIAIYTGEMDGAKAFMQGKFSVEGDLRLLMKMRDLFKRS